MTITEQKDHLDFAKIGDTGQDNIDAIGPITDGQPATQSTFRRPSENLRERTEDIRQAVEDSFYLRDVQQMAITTKGTITWQGTVADTGTGKILQSDDLIIRPFLRPSADTKASISIGAPGVDQITYTVSAAGFSTQRMNQVFIEHRNGGVATVLTASISDGPVKRILVTFDLANPLHDAATTKGLVDAAVVADTDLNGKITVTTNAVPANAIVVQAETRLEGTAEAEEHVLTAGVLDTFTTANPLAEGDTVAIWYRYLVDPIGGFDGRRESTSSHGTNAVPAASLFITSQEPSKIPGAIPICTVVPGTVASSLVFIDGTAFLKGETHTLGTVSAALVPYDGGPNWADATTNPANTVEGQLDKIISDLGQGVSGTAKVSSNALGASAPGNDAVGASALFAQLQTLLDLINDRADLTDLTTQIFKGLLTLEKTVTFKQGDVPLGATPRISMEEASVPTNLLIILSQVAIAPNQYIRVYSGNSINNVFQVTFNAKWDGTGLWVADSITTPATRLFMDHNGIRVNRILSPLATWPEGSWVTIDGSLSVSFISGYNITAANRVRGSYLEATGIGGVISNAGDIAAPLNNVIGANFLYPGVVPSFATKSNVLFTEGYNIFRSPNPEWFYNLADGNLYANAIFAMYSFSIKKPTNAIINTIRIAYSNAALRVPGTEALVNIFIKETYDYTGGIADPAFTNGGYGGPFPIPGANGNVTLAISGLNLMTDPRDQEITFQVLAAGLNDQILGVRVDWRDPGPSNL